MPRVFYTRHVLPIRSTVHESHLGHWSFHEGFPGALSDVIEGIWEVEGTVANTRERIFPSGSVDLLVNLGEPQWLLTPRSVAVESELVWLSGIHDRPLVVESQQHVHVFCVRLRPEAANILLGIP